MAAVISSEVGIPGELSAQLYEGKLNSLADLAFGGLYVVAGSSSMKLAPFFWVWVMFRASE